MDITTPIMFSIMHPIMQPIVGPIVPVAGELFLVMDGDGDFISQDITTITTGIHPNYDGDLYGDDEIVLQDGRVLTYGQFEQLISYPKDISNAAWDEADGINVIDATHLQGTQTDGRISQFKDSTEGVLYTFSFKASVESGGQTTNYVFYHGASASGNDSPLVLSETLTTHSVTVLGRVGDGQINWGFRDRNTSNWAEVEITDFLATPTPYLMPFVDNPSASTLVVPPNNSDTDEGSKIANTGHLLDRLDGKADGADAWNETGITYGDGWSRNSENVYTSDGTQTGNSSIKSPNHGEIGAYYEVRLIVSNWSAGQVRANVGGNGTLTWRGSNGDYTERKLSAGDNDVYLQADEDFVGTVTVGYYKIISPAQAEWVIPWKPLFAYETISAAGNIFTCDDSTPGMISYNATGGIELYDGTNTAIVDFDWDAETQYSICASYGEHPVDGPDKMQIVIKDEDGVVLASSDVEDFVGTFSPGDETSYAWESDPPQIIGETKVFNEPTW